MGSIGDRLGLDLGALFGEDGEASSDSSPSPVGPKESAPTQEIGDLGEGYEEANGSESPERASTLEEVIVSTIAELTLRDGAIELDSSFEDLDLSGLPLWALVAEAERVTGNKFEDSQVDSWVSPRDLLNAAEKSPETV